MIENFKPEKVVLDTCLIRSSRIAKVCKVSAARSTSDTCLVSSSFSGTFFFDFMVEYITIALRACDLNANRLVTRRVGSTVEEYSNLALHVVEVLHFELFV